MGEKMKLVHIRRLKKELEAVKKDRDSWERRCRYLEAEFGDAPVIHVLGPCEMVIADENGLEGTITVTNGTGKWVFFGEGVA